MTRLSPAVFAIVLLSGSTVTADWITAPSYFTHDPQTSQRVRQYSPIGPFYIAQRGDYQRSGYRHMRSSIQVGTSADHMHIVDQWGAAVQPYEDWRFPFRPYAVPSPLWSTPNLWMPPMPFGGPGWSNGVGPISPYPGGSNGAGAPSPYLDNRGGNSPNWQDGNYSPYRTPRLPDRKFFWTPDASRSTAPPPPQPPADQP